MTYPPRTNAYNGVMLDCFLALGAPLLLPSLLDKAPRQGDIQEFAAARRITNAIGWVFWLGICDHMHGLYVMGDTA